MYMSIFGTVYRGVYLNIREVLGRGYVNLKNSKSESILRIKGFLRLTTLFLQRSATNSNAAYVPDDVDRAAREGRAVCALRLRGHGRVRLHHLRRLLSSLRFGRGCHCCTACPAGCRGGHVAGRGADQSSAVVSGQHNCDRKVHVVVVLATVPLRTVRLICLWVRRRLGVVGCTRGWEEWHVQWHVQ